MALTLSDVLQALYFELGETKMGKATSGTTTTLVDSAVAATSKDNVWRNGTLFITRDAAGAAPQGQFQRVSAYTNSSGTYTVDTAFSVAVGAADVYMVVSDYYPLQEMILAVNRGLAELGDVPLVDTTTLDTAAGTTEYAAAVDWKRQRPYRIDIQGRTGAASDNQWVEWPNFEWVPAAAGSTGKIIFRDYPVASRDIRVWYKGPHGAVSAYSDVINETLDPQLVVGAALTKAYQWQNNRSKGADEFTLQSGQKAEQGLMNMKVERPLHRPKSKPRLLIVGGNQPAADYFTVPD